MEELGIIRKSDSPYASPVVVVKKKDGSNRIGIDLRRLNKITVTDPQPVPSLADDTCIKWKAVYIACDVRINFLENYLKWGDV